MEYDDDSYRQDQVARNKAAVDSKIITTPERLSNNAQIVLKMK